MVGGRDRFRIGVEQIVRVVARGRQAMRLAKGDKAPDRLAEQGGIAAMFEDDDGHGGAIDDGDVGSGVGGHHSAPGLGQRRKRRLPRRPVRCSAKCRRRLAHLRAKGAGEGIGRVIARIERDRGDGCARAERKPVRCPRDPRQADVAVKRHADERGELAVKMMRRKGGKRAQPRQRQVGVATS